MTIEIRPAREDEMEEFARVRSYAFADHRGDTPDPHPSISLCAFVDGRLGATSAAWPFTIRWNGNPLRAAGVTMVSVRPELQGRGLLRAIMERALPQYREQGQAVAVLWASFGAIYQRFGFGPASHAQFFSVDPRLARLNDADRAPGRIEVSVAGESLARLKPLYIEDAASRTLALHRGELLWQFGILRAGAGEGVFAAVYHDRDERPRGYAVYETRGPGLMSNRSADLVAPMQDLVVRDLVALDGEAYAGLWKFLCGHDLVQRIQIGPLASDDPAPLLLAEPNRLVRRVNTGIWLRVVDVEAALRGRAYDASGELVIEVRGDRLCDWNDGRYLLRAGPEPEVGRAQGVPDLVLPPRSLASLVCGYASASDLYRAGLLDVKDPGVLVTADSIFRTRRAPHCADAF